jgi:hypothetical protein
VRFCRVLGESNENLGKIVAVLAKCLSKGSSKDGLVDAATWHKIVVLLQQMTSSLPPPVCALWLSHHFSFSRPYNLCWVASHIFYNNIQSVDQPCVHGRCLRDRIYFSNLKLSSALAGRFSLSCPGYASVTGRFILVNACRSCRVSSAS